MFAVSITAAKAATINARTVGKKTIAAGTPKINAAARPSKCLFGLKGCTYLPKYFPIIKDAASARDKTIIAVRAASLLKSKPDIPEPAIKVKAPFPGKNFLSSARSSLSKNHERTGTRYCLQIQELIKPIKKSKTK